MEPLFGISINKNYTEAGAPFKLHVHNDYEIFMFLQGDSRYVIEENVYDLKPYDIIVIRKHQMHRIHHNSPSLYSRIVLNVKPEFFSTYNCTEYEEQFIDPYSEIGNKIDAKIVKNSGIYEAFMRMLEYTDNFSNLDSPIARAGVMEILYLISNIKSYSKSENKNNQLKEVIAHINKNFTQPISLDTLEKDFFISKYHLCHIFPKATGMTVHQYITQKRLAHAKDLLKTGISVTDVAKQSGFNNYSSFYRAYTNEYGNPPGTII